MKHVHDDCYTRTRTRVLTVAIWLGLAVLVVVSEQRRPDYEQSGWTLVILGLPCVVLAARACFYATVCVSDDAFCYRGLFRNHVRPWTKIDRFELVHRRGHATGDAAIPDYISLVMFGRVDDPGARVVRYGTLRWLGSEPNDEARRIEAWLNGYVDRHGEPRDADSSEGAD